MISMHEWILSGLFKIFTALGTPEGDIYVLNFIVLCISLLEFYNNNNNTYFYGVTFM